MHKLEAIKNEGGKVEEITLAPLAHEHLGQLIADALRCEPRRAALLTQLVHEPEDLVRLAASSAFTWPASVQEAVVGFTFLVAATRLILWRQQD